ncbi:hypothetical protein G7Z17_g9725 [Cylindrodendrum hubeiense]|uniref:F-box domain-containing protein n=1 Tax=Cylindrodendrum hubeiense TaxID=595255 RepID=A0A9P5LDD5_9HYPO|nr:hypothetical protein G7Z17_g9725 [Cylindrodendrum hubeiense]
MSDFPPAALASLPPEIIEQIFSLLPRTTLCHLRLLHRRLGFIATAIAFRTLRLQAFGNSPQRFTHIAQSDKLRGFVKDITCDTWIGPEYEYHKWDRYEIPLGFFAALPLLRHFRGLKALHLRFSQYCGREGRVTRLTIEETGDFRYRVLDVIFQCLAGTWSAERQQHIDQLLGLASSFDVSASDIVAAPISLSALTISNLGDYHDARLTESDAFKEVLASSSLVDLRIYIATQLSRFGQSRNICYRDKHTMFESLPATWLSQPVTSNLRVLSLYCYEYWGWLPKLDLRAVGGGAGLPNLKVLALGKYVFSHEWQVDWFPTLGLEELYLDDCRMLYQSKTDWTPDDRTSVVGQDANGNDVVISNEGYLRYDDVWDSESGSNIDGGSNPDSLPEPEEPNEEEILGFKMIRLTLRWHTLLSRWRDSMSTLRVFKVGYGAWDEKLKDYPKTTRPIRPNRLVVDKKATIGEHYLKYNAFRDFDCLSSDQENKKYQLKYLYDQLYQWYEWRDWAGGWTHGDSSDWVLEDGLEAKDEAALELLLSTVNARQR